MLAAAVSAVRGREPFAARPDKPAVAVQVPRRSTGGYLISAGAVRAMAGRAAKRSNQVASRGRVARQSSSP